MPHTSSELSSGGIHQSQLDPSDHYKYRYGDSCQHQEYYCFSHRLLTDFFITIIMRLPVINIPRVTIRPDSCIQLISCHNPLVILSKHAVKINPKNPIIVNRIAAALAVTITIFSTALSLSSILCITLCCLWLSYVIYLSPCFVLRHKISYYIFYPFLFSTL